MIEWNTQIWENKTNIWFWTIREAQIQRFLAVCHMHMYMRDGPSVRHAIAKNKSILFSAYVSAREGLLGLLDPSNGCFLKKVPENLEPRGFFNWKSNYFSGERKF